MEKTFCIDHEFKILLIQEIIMQSAYIYLSIRIIKMAEDQSSKFSEILKAMVRIMLCNSFLKGRDIFPEKLVR